MKIKEVLREDHSKVHAQLIADEAIGNEKALEDLMECFFDDHYRLCQRAAWPVGIIGQQRPELIFPYLPKMIRALDNPRHDAVIRNTVRTLQYMAIPEELQGEVYDKCFQYLSGVKYPPAIKVFSATVLANMAMEIPELKEELIIILEEQMVFGTAGFVNRAGKLLKSLRK